jgi:hypothetical protein
VSIASNSSSERLPTKDVTCSANVGWQTHRVENAPLVRG